MSIADRLKDSIANVGQDVKKIFIRVDTFRENVEDAGATILEAAGNYTTLDDFKAAMIDAMLIAALNASTSGVAGTIATTLTSTQILAFSKSVVRMGHKCELAWAKQLRKKGMTYKKYNSQ